MISRTEGVVVAIFRRYLQLKAFGEFKTLGSRDKTNPIMWFIEKKLKLLLQEEMNKKNE
jgi:hypothetical protein